MRVSMIFTVGVVLSVSMTVLGAEQKCTDMFSTPVQTQTSATPPMSEVGKVWLDDNSKQTLTYPEANKQWQQFYKPVVRTNREPVQATSSTAFDFAKSIVNYDEVERCSERFPDSPDKLRVCQTMYATAGTAGWVFPFANVGVAADKCFVDEKTSKWDCPKAIVETLPAGKLLRIAPVVATAAKAGSRTETATKIFRKSGDDVAKGGFKNVTKTETKILEGVSKASKKGHPNSVYEQVTPDGKTVKSRTWYNEMGKPFERNDYVTGQHGIEGFHTHKFGYNQYGQRNWEPKPMPTLRSPNDTVPYSLLP